MSPSTSQRLREKVSQAEPWVAPITERFWAHPNLAAVFPEFMVRLYWSSQGSVDAILVARDAARQKASEDSACASLASYYAQHYDEERAHPGWLLDDMAAIGLDVAAVRARRPDAGAAALIGAQLYWVSQAHPIALLGHFFVLEGNPPSAPLLHAVQERTGLPRAAFRMMEAHASLDIEHIRDIEELLDELPVDESLDALLGLSALHTLDRVAAIYTDLLELADGVEVPAASKPAALPVGRDHGLEDEPT